MQIRDVVVVGASAGGVEVLRTMVAGLPAGFPAAVLIVLHLAPGSPSVLAAILQRRCALPVAFARDGEPLAPGRVWIAPPDRHLVVEPDRLRLTRAPRENHSRPAIDPLFRSAALAYGPRVVAVVLSGRLDDGTAGAWAVKDRGGVLVVQDPADALHADMPRNAMAHTAPDHVVHDDELAPLLVRLAGTPADAAPGPPAPTLETEVRIAMEEQALGAGVLTLGPPSPYTCPDCHGVLMRADDGVPRFRCHTGHAYSFDSLLASTSESAEAALWGAVRAVEETALLLREAATRTSRGDGGEFAAQLARTAADAQTRADAVREAAMRHRAVSLEAVRADDAAAPGG
ncbi:chemotaxis protein CheB [Roseisolibacter sp. H3M3-2]|uniref:chemotaxis protein CheB n=1 Tax=Roseisolibacter sp. H3M3-2 TaxID=3031323 RepID=UPI0023DBA440|nr:chemotaxis protein CheB [Roseisolibacter sp. H3M3-2]MDF1504415.1 chemotaxis protein CheB [Roseisolibacter sp. H3M3-2]